MANTCDPRYPQPVQYYFETKCGRTFGWSAPDLESLFRQAHEKNYTITFVQTLEEHETEKEMEALIEMSKAHFERELKEPA